MAQDTSRAEMLRAAARESGYPFGERADLWAQRLALHAADLGVLRGLRDLAEPQAPAVVPLAWAPGRGDWARAQPAATPLQPGNSAAALAAAVRARQVSATALARAHLDRVAARSDLNAFVTVQPEQVLAEAAAVDARLGRGEDPGPLAGVPVGVKDLLQVRGYPFTCGTRALPGDPAMEDAEAVARLRAAGAVVLGTTNLHELAYGVTSANIHFGAVVNPLHPDRIPGGSSGGSGAAVAAHLAPLALGSDTGGSIRIPAACCGITGFKPTYDAVSRHGVAPLAWSLDHIGPLATDVQDAALAFLALAGLPADAGDPCPLPVRLLQPLGYLTELLHADTRADYEATLARLAAGGLPVTPVDMAGMAQVPLAQFPTICAEACLANWRALLEQPGGISPDVRLRLEIGQFIPAMDYLRAQGLRRALGDAVRALLGEDGILVLPTLPLPVPGVGATTVQVGDRDLPLVQAMTRLTSPFNALGLPALSLPVRGGRAGPPFSLQLVGPAGADLRVLAVGRQVEALLAAAR